MTSENNTQITRQEVFYLFLIILPIAFLLYFLYQDGKGNVKYEAVKKIITPYLEYGDDKNRILPYEKNIEGSILKLSNIDGVNHFSLTNDKTKDGKIIENSFFCKRFLSLIKNNTNGNGKVENLIVGGNKINVSDLKWFNRSCYESKSGEYLIEFDITQ